MSTAQSKRPRPDSEDESGDHELKHKKLRPLPFRTSPNFESRTIAFSQRPARSVPVTLTPVESSDDDSATVDDAEDDDDMVAVLPPDLSSSQTSKTSSMSVGVGDDLDFDMADSQPRSPLLWQSRSTLSPPQPQISLSLPLNPSGGRISTPIYGHFINEVGMDMSGGNTPATAVPTIREEDEWWRRRDLPSPASDHDNPMISPMGEADGMMGRLNVGSGPGLRSPTSRFSNPVNSMFLRRTETQDTERSSRLLMGYRADCEKCRQKVPGHYSHIMRH